AGRRRGGGGRSCVPVGAGVSCVRLIEISSALAERKPRKAKRVLESGFLQGRSMNVKCPKCGADYNVHPDRVPLSGIDMKCSKCLHSFHVSPADLESKGPPQPRSTRLGLKGVTFLGGERKSA